MPHAAYLQSLQRAFIIHAVMPQHLEERGDLEPMDDVELEDNLIKCVCVSQFILGLDGFEGLRLEEEDLLVGLRVWLDMLEISKGHVEGLDVTLFDYARQQLFAACNHMIELGGESVGDLYAHHMDLPEEASLAHS